LKSSIPEQIQVIDIGGGLVADATGDTTTLEQVIPIPFKAILQGMSYPGIWSKQATPLNLSDFFFGMERAGDLLTDSAAPAFNLAVIARQYMNLTLRFGYRFNLVDSYMSERPANNHIYFRFVGGAAVASKRLRRIQLVEIVLKQYGFITRIKGDLIEARVSHISQDGVARVLDLIGRLIAFTRQLDVALSNDSVVKEYADRFLAGDYVT
jgi:pyruvate,water dikinase